jgi:undecaprenyl-diphosphatase
MSLLDALILGVVQGLTEFLPVSSTGHLILARDVLGIVTDHGLAVDAMFHFATAFAVLVYFRKDIVRLAQSFFAWLKGRDIGTDRTLIIALVLGTIPAAAAGFFLESSMDTLFRSAELVAWVLIAGSVLFVVAEYVHKRYAVTEELTVGKGVAIGFFQALALVPGMSRSGATISGGLLLGLAREEAARYAFLLSFPIIIGAGSKKLLELGDTGVLAMEWLPILLGGVAAFVSGVLAIHYLLQFLRNHTLLVFVVYRVALALLVLVLA